MISIIVPTHNEEKRIRGTLLLLEDFLENKRVDYEVIVVDDGSDATAAIAGKIARKNKRFQVLRFEKRQGKGGAIMRGMKAAKGDVVIYDADASAPAREILKLIEGLAKAAIVVGSRKLPDSLVHGVPPVRLVTSALFSLIVRILFNLGVRDTQCGFKAIRKAAVKKLLPQLKSTGFVWDVELLARAKNNKMRVLEVPIEWTFRAGGTMRPLDTLKMLYDLLALRKSLG